MTDRKFNTICFLSFFTPILVVLIFIVALAVDRVDAPTQLEQMTRTRSTLQSNYLAPKDDDFMLAAIEVEAVVENVMGVSVNYINMDDTPEYAGWTLLQPTAPRAVNVDKSLRWTARLEVLAHEAGHRLQPVVFLPTSSESEVFAETVSFLVCRAYGHDTLDKSAAYLAIHKGGLHVITDYRLELDYAVQVLMGGRARWPH